MPPVKNPWVWLPTAALSASGYRVEVRLLPLSLQTQAPLYLLFYYKSNHSENQAPIAISLRQSCKYYQFFLQQKSYVRSISGLHADGSLFLLNRRVSLFIAGQLYARHLVEMAWPSPLVKLLYNRCQKMPSCIPQLCNWFIPHKYYGQNRNTRTQQVAKSYAINTKV